MNFHSLSQVGQDAFAFNALGCRTDGTFLDIGMNDPIVKNNTAALEALGWRGVLVDNDEYCCRTLYPKSGRKAALIEADATTIDWLGHPALVPFGGHFDYLSLDVDAATLRVLQSMPLGYLRFEVITIEHDSYRFGPGPRDEMRKLLWGAGYVLRDADVSDLGMPFEDWWFRP